MKEEIEKYAGKTGHIELNGLKVKVNILDYKTAYGNERWLVSPISGSGQTWTEQNPLPVATE